MKTKLLLGLFLASLALPVAAQATPAETKTYGIHLFFDEKEFVDVLTVTKHASGAVEGHMVVPDDFEGKVDNLEFRPATWITGPTLSFDLFVPKNASRPKDLIFHYRGTFFDSSEKQLNGFVTIQGQPGFVASFVGFQRD